MQVMVRAGDSDYFLIQIVRGSSGNPSGTVPR